MLSKYFLADYVDSCFSLTRSNGESCVLTNLVVLKPGWRLESYLGSLPNVDKYIGTSIHKWMMDACLGLIAVQMNLNPWGSGGFYPCGVFISSLGNSNIHPELGGRKMNSLNLFCYVILAKCPLIKQAALTSFSLCQSPTLSDRTLQGTHSSTGGR